MDSRELKYGNKNKKVTSRQEKNQELYEEINKTSIDNFDVFSNATVIGESETNQIDVEKIKRILDTKYNEAPKRRSIKIEEEKKIASDPEETKEYDLNAIIDKAKSEKIVSYKEEKIKKPNIEQYEILKNLDLDKKDEEDFSCDEESVTLTKDEPKELLDLINTIVINEKKLKDDNTEVALDLFEDLKAEEGEEVIAPISEIKKEIDDKEKLRKFEKTQIKIEKINLNEDEEKSFETKETKFKKTDFEALDDEEDEEEGSILFKIFIFLLVATFIAGMYYFLTTYLGI